jgi:subfamily B ATP-binding cassette protein MsbA
MLQNFKNFIRPAIVWYAKKLSAEAERVLWLVLEVTLTHRLLLSLMLLVSILGAVFEGSTMGLMVIAVEHITNTTDSPELLNKMGEAGEWLSEIATEMSKEFFFLLLITLAVAGQLLRVGMQLGGNFISALLGVEVFSELQQRMVRQIMRMSYPQINKYKRGELATFVGQSASIAGLVRILNDFIGNALIVSVYIGLMVWLSWHLTIIGIFGAVLFSWGITFIFSRLKAISKRALKASIRASNNNMELLNAPKLLRVYAKEQEAEARMLEALKDGIVARKEAAIWSGFISPATDGFTIIIGASTLIGGLFLLNSIVDNALPTLLGFVLVMNRLMSRVAVLNGTRSGIAQALPSAQMFTEVLRTDNKHFTRQNGKIVKGFTDCIRFEQVCFTYPSNDVEVITDLSFTIKQGQMVAFVGSSGAGKSTVSDLMLGLYETTGGEVCMDNVDFKTAEEKSWREQFGVVTQESSMFNTSIKGNISFSKFNATDAEIEEAANIANATEFINGLEEGFDTMLGDQGYRLSGGQNQRLALARAVLPKPPILLLDEATSALDTLSERRIVDAIENMKGTTTMIIIAHRLSTIMNADKIFVLDQGKLVEQGNHDELLAENGIYANLWHMQTRNNRSK